MTGAHLGGRGAGRRRSCSATAAPREGGRRRGHGDGRHHPRPQRSFFSPNSDRRKSIFLVTKLCSWTRPNLYKAALITASTKASATGQTQLQQAAKQALQSNQHSDRSLLPISPTQPGRREVGGRGQEKRKAHRHGRRETSLAVPSDTMTTVTQERRGLM